MKKSCVQIVFAHAKAILQCHRKAVVTTASGMHHVDLELAAGFVGFCGVKHNPVADVLAVDALVPNVLREQFGAAARVSPVVDEAAERLSW